MMFPKLKIMAIQGSNHVSSTQKMKGREKGAKVKGISVRRLVKPRAEISGPIFCADGRIKYSINKSLQFQHRAII